MELHGLCPHVTPARATTDLCSSERFREGGGVWGGGGVCLLSAMDSCASLDMRYAPCDVY